LYNKIATITNKDKILLDIAGGDLINTIEFIPFVY